MSSSCTPSAGTGGALPYRINGTFICGVNPFVSPTLLASCCLGPITNITTPAPTSGAYSDSWPLACLAYCAVTRPPDGPPYTYPFGDCMNRNTSNTYIDWVCTEANGFAPNECIPLQESPGCTSTNAYTTSTYWPSGYTSVGMTASESSADSTAAAGIAITGSAGGPMTGSATGSGPAKSSSTNITSVAPILAYTIYNLGLEKMVLAIALFGFLAS